ncbi:LmeA family phospholipid-binding protein [Frankia sp. AgB1.9]|nr:LmeA family phospholipid-binding protein [Frankia sp. AgW1.1]MBL7552921.1 LmeA family phospholipid-binding protein [Frankia sp. AgB1.9]MBL7624469.1 LmeA family phospholipid-binding protein [Frankia sp. AgB1.8]
MGTSSRAWVGVPLMGDDPVNNPADDDGYEPGEATSVRRPRPGEPVRPTPARPGAPSGPPPPADSFRPAGPPPPVDWFKPAPGRDGQGRGAPAGSGGGDQTSRPRRDAGPGRAGYTSQPGIPAERYPTPRPGEFPSPVPPTRRSSPPATSRSDRSDRSGGADRSGGRSGQDRPGARFDRQGSDSGTPPVRPGESTEYLGYAARGSRPAETTEYSYGQPAGGKDLGGRGGPDPVTAAWSADGSDGWAAGGQARDGYAQAGPGTGGTPIGPSTGGVALGDQPPPKRRRRRGRKIALIVVLVLLVLAIPVDRIAAHVAVGQMRKQVDTAVAANLKPGQQPPIVRKVSIGGFPFLTQVLFGKFKDIGVSLEDIPTTADGPKIASVDAHLRGVHVPFTDAISNKVGKVPVDNVAATVVLNYDDLNKFLDTDKTFHLHLTPVDGGKQVKVTGKTTLDVPVIGSLLGGQSGTFSGTGAFNVQNNKLFINPTGLSFDVGGIGANVPIPKQLGAAIPIPLPDNLPFSLTVVSAGSTATGLSVTATAKNVVLPAAPAAKK